jgi:hypothetical protein
METYLIPLIIATISSVTLMCRNDVKCDLINIILYTVNAVFYIFAGFLMAVTMKVIIL